MRECRWFWFPACLAGLLVGSRAENTFAMTWSTKSFGPDGPWHAVQIGIGSVSTQVALYPGGSFASHILTPDVCGNETLGATCYAQNAGLYNSDNSDTAIFGKITGVTGGVDFSGGALAMGGTPGSIGSDSWSLGNDMETADGMDMAIHRSVYGTLPDGTIYPISVGTLSLGAPGTINQTFGFGAGSSTPAINITLLGGWLANYAPSNKRLSSNAYGMHIGSVSPKIAPSLQMGGYDQNRVMGTVSTQQGSPDSVGAIDLIDIAITVIDGESLFNFTSLGGLLASGNSSMGATLPIAGK